MQRLRGQSDFSRGTTQGTSGEHAALLHSMVMQYNSGLHSGQARAYRELGQHVLEVWQRFATTERVAEIAGPRQDPLLQSFKGEDISDVRRVVVDIGSAAANTKAQKTVMADKLLAAGAIQDPRDYFQVLTTGQLEHMLDPVDAHRRGLDRENELLLRGEPVQVLKTDHHIDHITAHMSLLDEPAVRNDDEAVQRITAHVQLHNDIWRHVSQSEPDTLLFAGRGQPLPPHPSIAAMMGAPAPGGPAPNPGGGPNPGPVPEAPPEAGGQPSMPDMPTPPGQPSMGGSYDPASGDVV